MHGQLLLATIAAAPSFGGMFSLGPVIVPQLFGVPHFGVNWGLVLTAPAVGSLLFGAVFSALYGRAAASIRTRAVRRLLPLGVRGRGAEHGPRRRGGPQLAVQIRAGSPRARPAGQVRAAAQERQPWRANEVALRRAADGRSEGPRRRRG